MARTYDDDGHPVYCRGSGKLLPGSPRGSRRTCPYCGERVLVTRVMELRKHFAGTGAETTTCETPASAECICARDPETDDLLDHATLEARCEAGDCSDDPAMPRVCSLSDCVCYARRTGRCSHCGGPATVHARAPIPGASP